jgi:hypothetical protein
MHDMIVVVVFLHVKGMVAAYVAKHAGPDVELLIADRTFSNLPAVAASLLGPWACHALRWVTQWDTDNVSNYIDATCYKILCCDPLDEVQQHDLSASSICVCVCVSRHGKISIDHIYIYIEREIDRYVDIDIDIDRSISIRGILCVFKTQYTHTYMNGPFFSVCCRAISVFQKDIFNY